MFTSTGGDDSDDGGSALSTAQLATASPSTAAPTWDSVITLPPVPSEATTTPGPSISPTLSPSGSPSVSPTWAPAEGVTLPPTTAVDGSPGDTGQSQGGGGGGDETPIVLFLAPICGGAAILVCCVVFYVRRTHAASDKEHDAYYDDAASNVDSIGSDGSSDKPALNLPTVTVASINKGDGALAEEQVATYTAVQHPHHPQQHAGQITVSEERRAFSECFAGSVELHVLST